MSNTKSSWLDREGKKKTSLQWKRWPDWDRFTECDNCGQARQEARIYKMKISMNQWNWLGGSTPKGDNPYFVDEPTQMDRFTGVDLCEVCIVYLKERGPQK